MVTPCKLSAHCHYENDGVVRSQRVVVPRVHLTRHTSSCSITANVPMVLHEFSSSTQRSTNVTFHPMQLKRFARNKNVPCQSLIKSILILLLPVLAIELFHCANTNHHGETIEEKLGFELSENRTNSSNLGKILTIYWFRIERKEIRGSIEWLMRVTFGNIWS